ncbi:MAG: hypothetical protein K6B41_07590 [Butyrivibrio sp.]|nr:hypothetical protein [Butyrivibrio sp.]
MSKKYNEIMNHIEVTPEMKKRILENVNAEVERNNSGKDKKKKIIGITRYMPFAAAAVVVIVVGFVALNSGIIGDNHSESTMSSESMEESAEESAGLADENLEESAEESAGLADEAMESSEDTYPEESVSEFGKDYDHAIITEGAAEKAELNEAENAELNETEKSDAIGDIIENGQGIWLVYKNSIDDETIETLLTKYDLFKIEISSDISLPDMAEDEEAIFVSANAQIDENDLEALIENLNNENESVRAIAAK